jgi:transcriptional regulator with XRE-family HTH domain
MRNPLKREPIEPIYIIIGRNIKHLRGNISQADLAVCLGLMRPSSICDIEKGVARISVAKLKDIADFFGVTVDYLLKERE